MFAKVLIIATFCVAVSQQSAVTSCGDGIPTPSNLIFSHCDDVKCKIRKNAIKEIKFEFETLTETESVRPEVQLFVKIPYIDEIKNYTIDVAEHSRIDESSTVPISSGETGKYILRMPIPDEAVADVLFDGRFTLFDQQDNVLACFNAKAMVVENYD